MISEFRAMLGRRHTVRAHFWQTLANYSQTGGALVIGIILARMLQPEVFGEFVMVSSVLAFVMIPLSFSPAQLLVSDCGRTPSLFGRVMGTTWVIVAVKLLALAAFTAWALAHSDTREAVVGLLVGVPMVLSDWVGALRADFEGNGEFKPNFVAQFSQVFTTAVCTVALVWAGWGVYGLAAGSFLGFIPQLGSYLALTRRHSFRVEIDRASIAGQFRVGFWLWLGGVSAAWFYRIDKIMLGRFGGDTQLGLYNRAFNYGPISHLALDSLMTNATVRAISSQDSAARKRSALLKPMGIAICGGVLNGLFWWLCAGAVVPFVFGPQWQPAVPAFRWLGWLSLAYVFSNGVSTAMLAQKQFRQLALVRLFGVLVLTAALGLLAWRGAAMTAQAVALAILFSSALVGLPMTFLSLRSLGTSESA